MIRVHEQPEYAAFHRSVRTPGAQFLAANPAPTSLEFSRNCFWTRAKNELHEAYGRFCAYTCVYLVDSGTIDHFLPKSKFPELAYEWSNFRLTRPRANARKGNTVEVLDPFKIENGWFVLDLPSCQVLANRSLPRPDRIRVNRTINILRLNEDDDYVQDRCDILIDYANGDVSLDFLRRRYPFLASEIVRQGIEGRVGELIGK